MAVSLPEKVSASTSMTIVPRPSSPTSSGDIIGQTGVILVSAFVAWRAAVLLGRLMAPRRYLVSIVAAGLMPLLFIFGLLIIILVKSDGATLENIVLTLSRMPANGLRLLFAVLVTGFGVVSLTVLMRRRRDARKARTDIGSFE